MMTFGAVIRWIGPAPAAAFGVSPGQKFPDLQINHDQGARIPEDRDDMIPMTKKAATQRPLRAGTGML